MFLRAVPCLALLTCSVVRLVAGVSDLSPQLQVVSGLVVGRAVSTQCKHAAGEAGQVAHLPLQVAILPLTDECQTSVGFADQVALDGLEAGKECVCVRGSFKQQMCVLV